MWTEILLITEWFVWTYHIVDGSGVQLRRQVPNIVLGRNMIQKLLRDDVKITGFRREIGTEEQRAHVEWIDAFRQICTRRLLYTTNIRYRRSGYLKRQCFRTVLLTVITFKQHLQFLLKLSSWKPNYYYHACIIKFQICLVP